MFIALDLSRSAPCQSITFANRQSFHFFLGYGSSTVIIRQVIIPINR